MRYTMILILIVTLSLCGCSLLSLDTGKKGLPPRPLETPAYQEYLRQATDLQRQAAETFVEIGAEAGGKAAVANRNIAQAVHSVVGAPIDPIDFAAIAEEGDGTVTAIVESLRREKARHVDALAQWESRVDQLQASLSAERAKSSLLGRAVGGLTSIVRWLVFGLIILAGLALGAKTFLKTGNYYVGGGIAIAGLVLAIGWLFIAAFVVKVALWVVGLALLGLGGYGAYEAVQHGRKSKYLDNVVTSVEAIRDRHEEDELIAPMLIANQAPGQDTYIRARKNAMGV